MLLKSIYFFLNALVQFPLQGIWADWNMFKGKSFLPRSLNIRKMDVFGSIATGWIYEAVLTFSLCSIRWGVWICLKLSCFRYLEFLNELSLIFLYFFLNCFVNKLHCFCVIFQIIIYDLFLDCKVERGLRSEMSCYYSVGLQVSDWMEVCQ